MRSIVVLGASGMLGSMVLDYLSTDPSLKVVCTVRSKQLGERIRERTPSVECSLLQAEQCSGIEIQEALQDSVWAINAIGITKPYIHEDNAQEIERAVRVNSLFPHLLARAAENSGCKVLQIATDCVFSGKRGDHKENDEHDPLDVYGKTKSLGEVYSPNVLNLRCSIIGPEPKTPAFLLEWFLGQEQHGHVNGFTNHYWNGVTTLHFAKLCHGIITAGLNLPRVQHLVPSGKISKAEMLKCFAASYHREDVEIVPTEAKVEIDRTLATSSETLNQQLWAAAGYDEPPSVPQMVTEMARFDYRFRREG